MKVGLIVAADSRDGIAKDGQMPWNLPQDLKRFRELTVGEGHNAVLMGHSTWLSLPERFRPLPKRLNLVLSRQERVLEGALVVASWEDALAKAQGCEWLWVIGGAQVYAQALKLGCVERIELTRVEGDLACDLHWPGLPEGFALSAHQPHLGFTFETWTRV